MFHHPMPTSTPASTLSRDPSVTHSELDEMLSQNLGSPSSALHEFDFLHFPRPPTSSTSPPTTPRSRLADHRLASLRLEHQGERCRRRAKVEAQAERFAALQARRRRLEEEEDEEEEEVVKEEPKALVEREERVGSAFRSVRQDLLAFSPPVNGAMPLTTIVALPVSERGHAPGSNGHGSRSNVSSADAEVLGYYEAATKAGLPQGLLTIRSPPVVREAPPESPPVLRRTSGTTASRRYEQRIRSQQMAPPAFPERRISAISNTSSDTSSVQNASAGGGGSTVVSVGLKSSGGSTASSGFPPTATTSLANSGFSRSGDGFVSTGGFLSGNVFKSGAPAGGKSPCRFTATGVPLRTTRVGGVARLRASFENASGATLETPRTGDRSARALTESPTFQRPNGASLWEGAEREIRSGKTRAGRPFGGVAASADRHGLTSTFDSNFRSQAPPGPLTELEQLFQSLGLERADLLQGADRREAAWTREERLRRLEERSRATMTSQVEEDDVFEAASDSSIYRYPPRSGHANMKAFSPTSSRTSSEHGSYMTPIVTHFGSSTPRRSDSEISPASVHMLPSPTSADYLLPRPEKREVEGLPDVRLDDMAWRRLNRDAASRPKIYEQPYLSPRRDFHEQPQGRRLGTFRTRSGISKRSRSTERSVSPPSSSDDSKRFVSSALLRFDPSGITTSFSSTTSSSTLPAAPHRRPPPPSFLPHRPAPYSIPRRSSQPRSVDLARPLAELTTAGVQTIVPRKFLLHKAASHDDIFIETETPFAFNISATARDICIAKVPSEEELRQEQQQQNQQHQQQQKQQQQQQKWLPGQRRLSGGVPVTLRVIFGSDPALGRKDSWRESAPLSRDSSYRSIYHVDLGSA